MNNQNLSSESFVLKSKAFRVFFNQKQEMDNYITQIFPYFDTAVFRQRVQICMHHLDIGRS